MPHKQGRKGYNVSLPIAMIDSLKMIAAREKRTPSRQIEFIIEEALCRIEKEQAEKAGASA